MIEPQYIYRQEVLKALHARAGQAGLDERTLLSCIPLSTTPSVRAAILQAVQDLIGYGYVEDKCAGHAALQPRYRLTSTGLGQATGDARRHAEIYGADAL